MSCCALADCPPPASSGGRPTASAAVFVDAMSGRTMTVARYFLALESVGMNQICAATDTHERHGAIVILPTIRPTSNTHTFVRSPLFGALQVEKFPTGAARFWLSQERTPEETVQGQSLHGREYDENGVYEITRNRLYACTRACECIPSLAWSG